MLELAIFIHGVTIIIIMPYLEGADPEKFQGGWLICV
jgi:hypothetical protein